MKKTKLDPNSQEYKDIVQKLLGREVIFTSVHTLPKKLPSPKLPKKLPSPKLPKKLPSPKLPSPKLSKFKLKYRAENEEMLKNIPKEFYVWDNGAFPFKVVIDGSKVTITDNTKQDMDGEFPREDDFANFSISIDDVDEIWLGCGEYDDYFNPDPQFFGNTILLVKGQKCISIASNITEFNLSKDEKVTRYISTVGNSGVPYGWIETTLGYYALNSFNCVKGVSFLSNKFEIDYQKMNMGCWETETTYPFKNSKDVPHKILVSRD